VIAVRASNDPTVVGRLVCQLIGELSGKPSSQKEFAEYEVRAATLIRKGAVEAYVAWEDDEAVGVLVLNQCSAIYAGGDFGEITELYVSPTVRSGGVGRRLLECAVDHAAALGWGRLEVGTPPPGSWGRTVEFYRRNGFQDVGLRLKLMIDRD